MDNLKRKTDDLKRKTIFGFAQLIVILGILLFIPAGTLAYWQAWLYLIVFAGSSALITVYLWNKDPKLLERRINAGPTAEKETAQKIIQAIAGLALISAMLLPAFDRRFGWSHLPVPIVILGDLIVALGFLILYVVFHENIFTAAIIEG